MGIKAIRDHFAWHAGVHHVYSIRPKTAEANVNKTVWLYRSWTVVHALC